MKPKSNIDIVITGNVAWLNIQRDAKFLYGIIRGLTRNDNYCCYAANAYLAELLDVEDERTVRRYLEQLKALDTLYCTDGYILAENGKIVFRQRLIVLSELRRKFEKKQEELRGLHDKPRKKNAVQAGNSVRAGAGNSVRLNINKVLPYENNTSSNNKKRNNPQPPCEGAEKAHEQTEQYLALGKYENVFLTELQKGELVREFGSDMALSLIEQMSAKINSGEKRFRKNTQHYDVLRYWGLKDLSLIQQKQSADSSDDNQDCTGGTHL